MNALLLKPQPKQLFEIQPQHSHPRLSLSRVLWTKFLRWVDKASPSALVKTLLRLLAVLGLALAISAPAWLLGFMTACAKWNGFRIPIFLVLLSFTLNLKRLWRWRVRVSVRGNQNTFEGLPVDELATFLVERGSFKRDEAMSHFGISQEKHTKIAETLEERQVLVRGPNNARVLNEITREQLVRQLGKKPGLAFHNGEWVEREGSYHLFLRDEERREQKNRESVERLERRAERAKKRLAELAASPFQTHELAL